MDPLRVIFVPGGLVATAMLVGLPVAAAIYGIWRWRAQRRVARGGCGRCGTAFASADAQYLVTGVTICERCANRLRRRLGVALPVITAGVVLFALTSGTAFITSLVRGGPELGWWLDGRWIPLLLPSLGVAGITAAAVALSKRANRLAAGSSPDSLPSERPVRSIVRGG